MSVKTTGIGSLPFQDIDDSIAYSLKHDLPYFPQILTTHGNMISQIKDFKFNHLESFILKSKQAGHSQIKFQIAGPNTSSLTLEDYKQRIEKLNEYFQDIECIFFLDEPILDSNSCLNEIFSLIHESGHRTGLHCCNTLTPNRLNIINNLNIDYFSYDAVLNENMIDKISCDNIILGCISTQTDKISKEKSKKISHISPTCGLALSERDPNTILEQLFNLRDNF